MRLLYGTTNPAKLAVMRRWLVPPALTLVGLSELDHPPAEVMENGETIEANARTKAVGYRDATRMTTLGADSGLYLTGVPDSFQPREHARRQGGRRMDDNEMIAHYAQLAHDFGGRILARYRNALCIAFVDGRIVAQADDSVASVPFWIVDTPHPKRVQGFPLDSLSVDVDSGRYYFDLDASRTDSDLAQGDGYRRFVQNALDM